MNLYKEPAQPHFKPEQAALILESFVLFDNNKDGKLSTKVPLANKNSKSWHWSNKCSGCNPKPKYTNV